MPRAHEHRSGDPAYSGGSRSQPIKLQLGTHLTQPSSAPARRLQAAVDRKLACMRRVHTHEMTPHRSGSRRLPAAQLDCALHTASSNICGAAAGPGVVGLVGIVGLEPSTRRTPPRGTGSHASHGQERHRLGRVDREEPAYRRATGTPDEAQPQPPQPRAAPS